MNKNVLKRDNGYSRWPRGLRRTSTAAGLLGLRVRIPSSCMSASCECVCVVRIFCDGPIPSPKEPYWVWYICAWSWSLDNKAA